MKRSKLKLTLLGMFIFAMTSCSKRDSDCEFSVGDVKSERKTGECYYLKQGKKIYLKREDCAQLCD